MKKSTILFLATALVIIGSLGVFALLDEEMQDKEVISEEQNMVKTDEPELVIEKTEESLDMRIKEALLTEEQQADLEALSQDPLEFITFIVQRLQKHK